MTGFAGLISFGMRLHSKHIGLSFITTCWIFLGACRDASSVDKSAFPIEQIERGVALMPTHCNTCHGLGGRNAETMLAPSLWAVRAHYLGRHESPEAFVDAVTAFLLEPDSESSLMPKAVQQYGLKMPVSLSEESIRDIAAAIYVGHVERPEWFRDYKSQHSDCDAKW